MEKLGKFFNILPYIFCILAFIWLLKALFLGLYPDFRVYYLVSKFFLDGVNYYAHPELLGISYSYPPIDFLLFLPFTIFPFQWAEIVWTILNFILLIFSLYYLAKIFSLNFFSRLNMVLCTLVFLSFPTKFTLGMGQLNILVLWLMVYGLWLIKNNKLYKSGLVFGAALSIKFSPIFLPLYFLLKFNKRVILGMAASTLAILILVLLFVPQATYLYYVFNILPNFVVSSWKLEYYNQSFAGLVGRSLGTAELASFVKTIVSLTVIVTSLVAIYKNKEKGFLASMLGVGVIITLSLLFNTFSWQHHFIWMVIPFYATIFFLKKKKYEKKYYVVLLISYLLISLNFPNPNVLPTILQSHVFFGGLILLLLDLKLLKKEAI